MIVGFIYKEAKLIAPDVKKTSESGMKFITEENPGVNVPPFRVNKVEPAGPFKSISEKALVASKVPPVSISKLPLVIL